MSGRAHIFLFARVCVWVSMCASAFDLSARQCVCAFAHVMCLQWWQVLACVCPCACAGACVHKCMCVRVCRCVRVCAYACVCMWVCTSACVCACADVCVCVHMHECACGCAHMCAYGHGHAHVCVRACVCSLTADVERVSLVVVPEKDEFGPERARVAHVEDGVLGVDRALVHTRLQTNTNIDQPRRSTRLSWCVCVCVCVCVVCVQLWWWWWCRVCACVWYVCAKGKYVTLRVCVRAYVCENESGVFLLCVCMHVCVCVCVCVRALGREISPFRCCCLRSSRATARPGSPLYSRCPGRSADTYEHNQNPPHTPPPLLPQ